MRDPGAPFAEFVEPFVAPGRGLSTKSRSDYARYLLEFDAFTGHSDLRTALTLENGERFRERLKERGRFRVPQRDHVLEVVRRLGR